MLDANALRSGSLLGRSATLASSTLRRSGTSRSFLPFRGPPRQQQQQQASARRQCWRRGRAAVAPCASWAQSTAVGRLRSAEVVGVVIVDAGRRTPEGDDLLIDFASAYGQAYKRGIVAVASPATLEIAVRDCVEEGADKIMVVPYLLSCGREVENDLPMALADVQLKLPGIRCIIGETISVSCLLTQHIENQVMAVEATPPALVEERWWSPEPEKEKESRPQAVPAARPGTALPPADQRQAWGEAVHRASARPEQQPWDVEVQGREPLREVQPIAAPKPAAAPKMAVAWSDDFSAALTGGVLVVDYRQKAEEKAQQQAAPAASSSQRRSWGDDISHVGSSRGDDISPAAGSSWGDDISHVGSSWGGNGASSGRSTGGGGSNGVAASSATTATPSDGPAYWYAHSSDTEEDTRAANGHSTFGASNGHSSHSAAGAPSFWPTSPGATFVEGGAAAAAVGGVAVEAEGDQGVAPLEDRLAHMEEQLQTITELLVRSRAGGRPAPGGRRNVPRRRGQPQAGDGATYYSPQQLEFLKRKEGMD